MSLRIWSDAQDLASLIPELARRPQRHYRKGEPVQIGTGRRLHTPKRHYVSYPDVEVHAFVQIPPWLESELDLLESSATIANLTRSGIVEAPLWIAVFAGRRIAPPPPSPQTIERARCLGIKIFVENYSSDPDRGEVPSTADGVDSRGEIPTKPGIQPTGL